MDCSLQGSSFHGILQARILEWSGLPFPTPADGKDYACNAENPDSNPGLGRSPGEVNGTNSNILAWRIPRTKEPSGLQPMDSQRVRHDEWLPLSVFFHSVRGVCNFLGSVSSQQFEATDVKAFGASQLPDSVIAPCYSSVLFRK